LRAQGANKRKGRKKREVGAKSKGTGNFISSSTKVEQGKRERREFFPRGRKKALGDGILDQIEKKRTVNKGHGRAQAWKGKAWAKVEGL